MSPYQTYNNNINQLIFGRSWIEM